MSQTPFSTLKLKGAQNVYFICSQVSMALWLIGDWCRDNLQSSLFKMSFEWDMISVSNTNTKTVCVLCVEKKKFSVLRLKFNGKLICYCHLISMMTEPIHTHTWCCRFSNKQKAQAIKWLLLKSTKITTDSSVCV